MNTLEAQMAVARSIDAEKLVEWERTGIGIKEEAWIAVVTFMPGIYRHLPYHAKTMSVSHAAMEADPLVFKFVPTTHQTDETEKAYLLAKCKAAPPPVVEDPDSEDDDLLSEPLPLWFVDSEDDDDEDEDNDDNDDSEDKLATLPAAKRTHMSKPPTSPPRPKKAKGPLGGYEARSETMTRDKAETCELLHKAGKTLAKIFNTTQDPSVTEQEREHAKNVLAKKLASASNDVVDAYKASLEGTPDPKPGEHRVGIYRNGDYAMRKQQWMIALAEAISKQFMVGKYWFTRKLRFAFYGSEEGAYAAMRLYEELFNDICRMASNHSWAQGFADEYLEIQTKLRANIDASDNKETALVVSNMLDLQKKARPKHMRDARPLGGSRGNAAAYAAGKAAASSYADGAAKANALM